MNVGIIGASGYTGLELIKMVHQHPVFNLNYVATTTGEATVSSLHPSLEGIVEMDVEAVDLDRVIETCELVFLAVPHQTAMELVQKLMQSSIKIVDLSADYRLDLKTYEEHYCPHIDSENLDQAVYGLPELYREEIKQARLIANPGCYPTSAILALAPFAALLKRESSIFVDAKSGVSGAGKKCVDNTHFVSINDNMFAYNPLKHRHGPEISEKLSLLCDKKSQVFFVPHLVPITRGMLTSVYVELDQDVDARTVLENYYDQEPFVRIRKEPVSMKQVAGTNFCDIYVKQEGRVLFLSSAVDNLLRGASSQALVNANLMAGLDEALGVPKIAYVP